MAEPNEIRKHPSPPPRQPRQPALAFESAQCLGLSSTDRLKAVKRLAQILLQAAGILEERDHER
jgi:hypothetical protein